MKKLLIVIVIAIAVAAGIYFYKGGSATVAAKDNSVLAYVPADTVLFTGSVTPISFEEAMAMSHKLGLDPSTYMDLQDDSFELGPDSVDAARIGLGLYAKYMQSFADESTVKTFGITEAPNAAFYTAGAVPVMRIELDGTDTFAKLIEQIETEQNVTAEVKNMDGVEFREYAFSNDPSVPYSLVISSHDNQAVMTVNTPLTDDKDIKVALSKPAKSIVETGRLTNMMSEHGYLGHSLFFIDNLAIMQGLTNPQANSFGVMVNDLLIANGVEGALADMQTPACASEFTALTANWPTMSGGYTEFSASEANFKFMLEGGNADLLDSLQGLRGHLSENLNNDDYVMSFGLGFDMDQMVPVITDVWQRLTETPYECPPLAEMQAGLKQQNPMMLGMMTGMVAGIKGIGFGIVEMDMAGLEQASTNPMAVADSMQMIVTVSAQKPQDLLMTLSSFAPQFAQMDIKDGGDAVSLQDQMGMPASVALRGHDLVMLIGADALSQLPSIKSNKDITSNGLFSMSMNFGKYMELMSSMMNEMGETSEVAQDQKAMFDKLKEVDGTIKGTLDITDEGVVSETSFKAK
ncbi:hypothetical protein [Kangiella sp.]|uniref:hypothetical protein n=1 Tax=Kangiella sp. TaxID=1920245 RepID=UPI0019A5502F|nr:hypothetical protein [Kangiella sp.]MBD3652572.1 hypothetical protein [Kangiella sp.]